MHVIRWAFEVRRGCEREFEKVYGPRGAWVRLFEKQPGYAGTELLHDANRPARSLTIDRWESRESYDAFKERARAEYEKLNARGEALTRTERIVGRFETVP